MTQIDIPAIRPTMRGQWRQCPRRIYFPYVAGIVPRAGRKPLVVGKSYHYGIETFRNQKEKDIDAAALIAGNYYVSAAADERIPYDDFTWRQVFAYVSGYAAAFDGDFAAQVVEASVFEEGDGESGTADCVVEMPNGDIWVLEDKTVRDFSVDADVLAMSLKLNDQVTTYVHALRARGIPVKGARYRQVKKTMTYPKKGESVEDYGDRVTQLYNDTTDNYREVVVEWTDAELARAFKERERLNLEMIGYFDQTSLDAWPYNPASCIGPYGPCEYVKLCVKRCDRTERNFQPKPGAIDNGQFQKLIWGAEAAASSGPDLSVPTGYTVGVDLATSGDRSVEFAAGPTRRA